MLPKHWGEPVGGGEVAEQLAAKQLNHNSFLLILSSAGILQQLPPLILRCALPGILEALARGCGRLPWLQHISGQGLCRQDVPDRRLTGLHPICQRNSSA